MGILTGPEIERVVAKTAAHKRGEIEGAGRPYSPPFIEIDPFDPRNAGPNSYDLTLGDVLCVYRHPTLDMRKENPADEIRIPSTGFLLTPGELYLGHTVERTWCAGLVPIVEGRSSIGRLGICVHLTAGLGDDGVNLQWTLEITCVKPVVIYPSVRIAQLLFVTVEGDRRPYVGKYQHSSGVVVSRACLDEVRQKK